SARASRSSRSASRPRRLPVIPRVRSTLIATLRASCGSCALSTTPMPPAPITSRISKRPNAALSCSPLHSFVPLVVVLTPESIWIVGTAAGSTAMVSRASGSSFGVSGIPADSLLDRAGAAVDAAPHLAPLAGVVELGADDAAGVGAPHQEPIVGVVEVDLEI